MKQPETKKTALNRRVIIVEDDQDLRESIIKYLTLAGHDIDGVGSALQLYQNIAKENYALAVLDIGLPDQNGLVLAEYLRSNTEMRIIMLTARTSLDDKLAGYNSGADVYMVKPVDFQELSASITNILGRLDAFPHKSIDPENSAPELSALANVKYLPWALDQRARTLHTPEGNVIELTGREFDFISCLASNGNEAVRHQVILKSLLYQDDESSKRSLESLIHRLRTKIVACCNTVPIKTLHGIGYCFSAPLTTR